MYRRGSSPLSDIFLVNTSILSIINFKNKDIFIRGHSLIGKTAILHIVISGSSPDVSNFKFIYLYKSDNPIFSWFLYGLYWNYGRILP